MRYVITFGIVMAAAAAAALFGSGCAGGDPLEARFRYVTIDTDTRTRHETPGVDLGGDFELAPAAALELVVRGGSAAPAGGRYQLRPWFRSSAAWSPAPALELELGQVVTLEAPAGGGSLWIQIVWLEREGTLDVGVAP